MERKPIEDPDSPESKQRMKQEMSTQELAFSNGQYTPGIVSWLAGVERDNSVGAIRQMSEDLKWQEDAIADLDRAKGYEDDALTRLQEAGIQIPTDDPEYVAIIERQMSETLERL